MADIASYVQPRTLYRYRSLEHFDRELQALEHGYLHCSQFTTLNDPMEGLFRSARRVRESDAYREIRREILDNKAATRLCSFTEVHDHELMWAHYADKFRGMCIAFNFPKLLSALPDDAEFVRMFYTENVPTVRRAAVDNARMILSCKNYRWLYEREWRLFAHRERLRYQDQKCVKAVYLGSRIDEETREEICSLLLRLKIPVHQMSISRYSMSFVPAREIW